MQFKIGQKVVFLREEGHGVIKSINKRGRYVIEDENGFDRVCLGSELAPVSGAEYSIDDLDISIIKEQSNTYRDNAVRKNKRRKERRSENNWEIDLHIEQLVASHLELSNADILATQLSALRKYLEKARSKSIPKIIVIHGVGEGILRYEVRRYLDKMGGMRYYDADFKAFGKGATAVEIDYNY
jgi:DNA-nicking Smr family endonuclease